VTHFVQKERHETGRDDRIADVDVPVDYTCPASKETIE
jgi:hypothetical protein